MRRTSTAFVAIAMLASLGAGTARASLVGYDAVIGMDTPAARWRFDDASTAAGQTALDSVGSAHGTSSGDTTQVTGALVVSCEG